MMLFRLLCLALLLSPFIITLCDADQEAAGGSATTSNSPTTTPTASPGSNQGVKNTRTPQVVYVQADNNNSILESVPDLYIYIGISVLASGFLSAVGCLLCYFFHCDCCDDDDDEDSVDRRVVHHHHHHHGQSTSARSGTRGGGTRGRVHSVDTVTSPSVSATSPRSTLHMEGLDEKDTKENVKTSPVIQPQQPYYVPNTGSQANLANLNGAPSVIMQPQMAMVPQMAGNLSYGNMQQQQSLFMGSLPVQPQVWNGPGSQKKLSIVTPELPDLGKETDDGKQSSEEESEGMYGGTGGTRGPGDGGEGDETRH